MISYCICLSLSDLSLSVLMVHPCCQKIIGFSPLFWLNNISLYIYTASSLSILTWQTGFCGFFFFFFISQLLWILLQETWENSYLFQYHVLIYFGYIHQQDSNERMVNSFICWWELCYDEGRGICFGLVMRSFINLTKAVSALAGCWVG